MLFASSFFMFVFLPAFLLLYFVLPTRILKNVWLLIASLVFYAWGEPVYIVLMCVSITANWLLALWIDVARRHDKRILVLAVVFNLLVIGFFKYESFLAGIVNNLLGFTLVPDLALPLPIGISFYTLQALSYVIDVYRKDAQPQRNILLLGMYVACFPQLIAGPIVRYQTIADQINNREETFERLASGGRLFVIGLAKKVLLSNTVALLANKMLVEGGQSIGLVGAWSGLLAYTFQIYFDFCGYSDMAIGLGRMMGFSYLRNFNYPYISRSVTEFWRRWHMSLSTFFRDYVYIPLGGSRCSKGRWVFNLSVVWFLTGLWHGAAWNYILWGVYYGLLLVGEKLVWGESLGKSPRLVQHLYTVLIFVFGWSFFWITDESQLFQYWGAMFGRYGLTGGSTLWELTTWEYLPVFAICLIAAMPVVPYVKYRLVAWATNRESSDFEHESIVNARTIEGDVLCVFDVQPVDGLRAKVCGLVAALRDIGLVVLFAMSCMQIVAGSFNPFIYFQF